MNFTEEQSKILNLENKSVIVSASAGSGKTFTMINKIFKLINEKNIDISKILVLTYTNSAAGEMKSKLINLVNENLEESSNKQFLIEQLDNISVANVSTFHSFYEKLIKEYYYCLNINPSFKIASDEQIRLIKNKAFSDAIDYFQTNEAEKFEKLTKNYSKNKKYLDLKTKIFSLDNFICSIYSAEDWLRTDYAKFADANVLFEIYNNYINDLIDYAMISLNNIFTKAQQLDEIKMLENISNCQIKLKQLRRSDFIKKLEIGFGLDSFLVRKANQELKDQLKKTKEIYKKNIDKFNFQNFEVEKIYENLQQNKENIAIFVDFYQFFKENLSNAKKNENVFDFADLEFFAYNLLKEEKIRDKILCSYDFIFVDEYQDVNQIQDKIVDMISKENNVFLVGDPKQSIYAFRQSDVELFNQKDKNFSENQNCESLSLKNNYRSNCEILNFCNKVFANLITSKTVGIDYKKTSMFNPCSKIVSTNPVNFLLCYDDKPASENNLQEVYSLKNCEFEENENSAEAKMIAAKISNLIGKQIFDETKKEFRNINFGDIAVLIRSRSKLSNCLIDLFTKLNIPYIYNDQINLKDNKQVLAMISLIKIVYKCHDERDVLNVLNRFFDFSFDEINQLKIENNFDNLELIIEKNAQKFEKYVNFCKKFKFNIEISGLYFAITDMIGCLNLEDNFENFLGYVQDNGLNNCPAKLIETFSNSEEILVDNAVEMGKDKVIITTMHSSKGLEYPIVFLADLSRELNKKSGSAGININKNLGLCVRNESELVGNSFVENAFKLINRKNELSENLRLLYVGMTRAKNELYLTADISKMCFEKVDENNIQFLTSNYINYIVGSLDKEIIDAINNKTNYVGDVKIEIIKDNECEIKNKSAEKSESEIDDLYQNFAYYENAIAQKTSVTNLNLDAPYESVNYVPSTFKIDEHINNVEKNLELGNLYHELLENYDFNNNYINFDAMFESFKEKYQKIDFDEKMINEIKANINFISQKILKLVTKNSKFYKEKEFMLNASPKEILSDGSDQIVLIQGKIDLFICGEKNILVDYKYSNLNGNKLTQKYQNQLKIYKFALENFLNEAVDDVFLFNIKSGEIISLKNI